MKSLGIDPSLTGFGYCVYDSDSPKNSKIVISGHKGTSPDDVPVVRFTEIRSLVRNLLNRFSVQVVGIESPAFNAGPFASVHHCLMMYTIEAVYEKKIDLVLFDPNTVKYLTGDKDFNKDDMKKFVKLDTMRPGDIQSDEADAYCIARHASRFHSLLNGILKPDELSDNELSTYISRKKSKKTMVKKKQSFNGHIFRENERFFRFSSITDGNKLPKKSPINDEILRWLELNVTSQ